MDEVSLAYLDEALRQARAADDRRPPFEIIEGYLRRLGGQRRRRRRGWST